MTVFALNFLNLYTYLLSKIDIFHGTTVFIIYGVVQNKEINSNFIAKNNISVVNNTKLLYYS